MLFFPVTGLLLLFFHNRHFKFELSLEDYPASEFQSMPCRFVNERRALFEVFVATTGSEHRIELEKDDFLNGIIYHCQR